MIQCKECKYWDEDGICDGVEVEESREFTKKVDAKRGNILFFTHDDSGLAIVLKTGPKFGCLNGVAR